LERFSEGSHEHRTPAARRRPRSGAACADPPAKTLDRLPGNVDVDPYWRLVAAFLVGYPPHSSRAYFGDLKAWYGWCAQSGIHPLAARRDHVDTWVRHLGQVDQPSTGRPASPASIARHLSCLSKFYDYGIRDTEALEYSPVANVRPPKVSDDSSTNVSAAGERSGTRPTSPWTGSAASAPSDNEETSVVGSAQGRCAAVGGDRSPERSPIDRELRCETV
jgi:hypothetical protein